MSVISNRSFGANNWCMKFDTLGDDNYLLTSLSNGECHLLSRENLASVSVCKGWFDGQPINCLQSFKDGHTFAVSSGKNIKIFDIRTNLQKNCVASIDSHVPVMSMTFGNDDTLVYGTELKGVDAQIHMFKTSNFSAPYRSFLDSHHDDVMHLKFHPTDRNVLISGSTDGYCNIYDLTQEEEDDALHQVINYESVHSCGFISPKRLYVLSHMETFSIHTLNDKSDELHEEKPLDFGNIREPWDCEYVVDVYPGFVACGKNSNSSFKILPFHNEKVDYANPLISLNNIHNGEIIRDVFVQDDLVYTCGEDGQVNISKSNTGQSSFNLPQTFWEYNRQDINQTNVFEGSSVEVDMDSGKDVSMDNTQDQNSENTEWSVVEDKKKSKSEDKKFKDKKKSKSKDKKSKDKKSKDKKSKDSSQKSLSHRYRPY